MATNERQPRRRVPGRNDDDASARRPLLHREPGDPHDAPAARWIGRSRLIVLVAVGAVLLAAFSLFLLGAIVAAQTMWHAWQDVAEGELTSTTATVEFLEIVAVMLKAVFFYLIGVGLYSLFVAPLNLTVSLGVETLNDLETKLISVVIVIMAVNFLERYIQGSDSMEVLIDAAALALAVAALVLFKVYAAREANENRIRRDADLAKREMFERGHEEQAIADDGGKGEGDGAGEGAKAAPPGPVPPR